MSLKMDYLMDPQPWNSQCSKYLSELNALYATDPEKAARVASLYKAYYDSNKKAKKDLQKGLEAEGLL